MTRQTGRIETELRQHVQQYIARHGHGSATKLGKAIHRSSGWVGLFATGHRHPSVDDAVLLARVLELDRHALFIEDDRRRPAAVAVDLKPVDRRELMLQRLFVRLTDDGARQLVIRFVQSLLRMQERTKPHPNDRHAADAAKRRA